MGLGWGRYEAFRLDLDLARVLVADLGEVHDLLLVLRVHNAGLPALGVLLG